VGWFLGQITAGAIAGWIAGERWLENGALSATVIIAVNLYELMAGPILTGHSHGQSHLALPHWVEVIGSWSAPLFGALGGYIARTVTWRIALRWLCALPMALVVYFAGVIITVKLGGDHFIFMIVATAAIMVGMLV